MLTSPQLLLSIDLDRLRHDVLPDLAQLGQHARHLYRPEFHVVDRTILRLALVPEMPAVEAGNLVSDFGPFTSKCTRYSQFPPEPN
eukprot:SAG25_NODE_1782_length_2345_cov_3.918077_5_plen_86_part_00